MHAAAIAMIDYIIVTICVISPIANEVTVDKLWRGRRIVHPAAGMMMGHGALRVPSCDSESIQNGCGVEICSFRMIEHVVRATTTENGFICFNITIIKGCFSAGKTTVNRDAIL